MFRLLSHIVAHKKVYLVGLIAVIAAGYFYANPQVAQNLTGYLLKDTALYEKLATPEPTVVLNRGDLGLETKEIPTKAVPVKLQTPNGNQVFREGDLMTIRWTMPYESKATLYLLSLGKEKGFVQKEVIAGNLTFPDIPYRWTVPKRNGQYWIQVEVNGMTDESDRFFTIKPKRDVSVETRLIASQDTEQSPEVVEIKNNGSAKFHNLEQELPENLDELLDQAARPDDLVGREPVGQMMANVIQTSVSTTWKAGDEVFIAGYQLQSANEDVRVEALTVINDLRGGFNQPVPTAAIRNVFLTDEQGRLIAVRGLREGRAVFEGLDIPVRQSDKTLLKVYATITTDPEAASEIADSKFRLGLRSMRGFGQDSGQLVTISDTRGIQNNDRINPQSILGAALRVIWPEAQYGPLAYGDNSLMHFSLESTGLTEANIQTMIFSTAFESLSEQPEVKNYHLSCTNTQFESLEMDSADGVFDVNRSLPPEEIVDCELTGEIARLGADNMTARVSLDSMSGDFIGPEGIDSAPVFQYDHSCKSIVFADAYLDKKVREALAIDHQNPLSRDEVERLRTLDASGRFEDRVTDLSGVECLRNLEELNVNNSQSDQAGNIDNIRYLDRLTALRKLDLGRQQIEDISALSGLTALQELRLSDNQVRDLGPLSRLSDLRTLDLSKNQIQDLSPLASLTALQTLNLAGNQARDLGPLKDLKQLAYLYLQDNRVADLSPLAGSTKLALLNVGQNRISDLRPLRGLNALAQLTANQNQITDIGALADLPSLEKVTLYDNQIKDLTPLVNLSKLKEVSLFNNDPFRGPRNCETIKTLKARGVTVKEDLVWCNK